MRIPGCRALLLTAALLADGCGMTPAPRYTSAPSAGGAGLTRELETRQRALRSGNSSRLMNVIRSYLGVPYKWGGTTRHGMDCSALTRAVYREAYGVELPRTSRQMYGLGKSVAARGQLRAGDLVFFRIDTSGPGVSHVGIYVGDGRFAHASSSRGGVIDPLSNPYFDKRYAGARRVLP
ncbi:MAG TPA: C40 family peptidase [Candidatus Latescibacteria bacterium]|nr:C40 family peptidase [Candidatus Latescibacterota bacterium]HJP29842.1 C40 family peptidase [Candidatus Latescibacterota bacterium]